jgi:Transposase domain (DUF772)
MPRGLASFAQQPLVRATLLPFGSFGQVPIESAMLPGLYSSTGRPSIDPELMIRMLIVGYCMGIRSERRLCEEFISISRIAGFVGSVWTGDLLAIAAGIKKNQRIGPPPQPMHRRAVPREADRLGTFAGDPRRIPKFPRDKRFFRRSKESVYPFPSGDSLGH